MTDCIEADLIPELEINSGTFEEKFRGTPVKRAKHSGYRRNVAVALGNVAGVEAIPALQAAAEGGRSLWLPNTRHGQLSRSGLGQIPMFRLLIATHNKGKMHEIHALLSDLPIELVSPEDVGAFLRVEEDGNTYVENATKKAVAFADASGLVSLADDSGLEVEALGGAPGLRSARYHSQWRMPRTPIAGPIC